MTVSFQILSSLYFIKNHLSFDGIIIDAENVFKSPTKEFNTKHHNLTAYPHLWFTWPTVGVQTPPASRKEGYIGLPNSVSTKGASDASDPSPGPRFPHSLAIPSAPCFILFLKESWDHVWVKGWSFTPYCHVPPPYKTYTSIGPQRGTVWDYTQHKNYANITWHSYTCPLYNIRFFGRNFKQFVLRGNSIRGKFKGGMSNYSGSKISNRTLCLVEAVRGVSTIENTVWLLLGVSVFGFSIWNTIL